MLLQIFSKAPIRGQVKSRLASTIGVDMACEVYKKLLSNTVKQTVSATWKTELWCAPDCDDVFLKSLGHLHDISLLSQQGHDLGERMLFSLKQGLLNNNAVVLIGSDSPVVTRAVVKTAFDSLKQNDAVFSPAEDGGYVLIGVRKTNDDMFKNVSWSTHKTLDQNISAIARCGLTYRLLSTLWDVDTQKDFERWESVNGRRFLQAKQDQQ